MNETREREGIVVKKTVGHYTVVSDQGTVVCTASNRLRRELVYPLSPSLRRAVVEVRGIRSVDPVAVGDRVAFVPADDGTGVIREVAPRRSKLSRLAAGSKPLEQVIVANVDQVVSVVAAALPKPKWGLLDRHLVSAEAAGLDALICITKMDLADEAQIEADVGLYERIGYRVLLTSAVTGRGIAALTEALVGKLSVFIGKSGVGKTTLLEAIQPGLGLRVQEVSGSTGKGRHTTTHLEMFPVEGGGYVVDTPGMREFGLWNVRGAHLVRGEGDAAPSSEGEHRDRRRKLDVAALFPEMRPYLGRCRFGADCSHTHEPGCAIKEAVQRGVVAESRYASYRKLTR